MCYRSGGGAGKHAFGARTAGANLVLGMTTNVGLAFVVGVAASVLLSRIRSES